MPDETTVGIKQSVDATKFLGNNARMRIGLFALVTVLAWFSAAVLVALLWSARHAHDLPWPFYLLPVIHLLPWLAGLQCLVKVRRAVRDGVMNAAAAGLAYSILIALLSVAYVTLSSSEIALALAWRLGTKVFPI